MTQLPKGSPQFISSSGKRSFLHVHVCFIYHAAMQKSRKSPSSTNPAQNEAQVSFSDQNVSVVYNNNTIECLSSFLQFSLLTTCMLQDRESRIDSEICQVTFMTLL